MRNKVLIDVRAALVRGAALCVVMAVSVALALGCAANEPPTDRPVPKRAASKTAVDARAKSNAPDPFDGGAGRPPTAATMYSLARIVHAQGKPDDAINLLKNCIQRYPNYAPAYNALAEVYLSLDRTKEAIAILNDGIRRFPKDPVLQNNLGMVHFLQEDYDTALSHFEHATTGAPGEPTYRANKAAALGMLGRTAEAAELYRRHLKQSDVHENVNVLMQARRAAAAQHAQAPTTAPADAPR